MHRRTEAWPGWVKEGHQVSGERSAGKAGVCLWRDGWGENSSIPKGIQAEGGSMRLQVKQKQAGLQFLKLP